MLTVQQVRYSDWSLPKPLANFGNHVIRLMKAHDGRDKVIKFAVAISEAINALQRFFNVSDSVQHSCHKLTHILKDTRTVTGLMNVFGSMIKFMVTSALKAIDLLRGLVAGHTVDFNEKKASTALGTAETVNGVQVPDGKFLHKHEGANHAITSFTVFEKSPDEPFTRAFNTYSTKADKALGLVAETSKALVGASYIAGFGICRPILFAGKLTELSKHAKNVGEKFGYCMFGLHIVGAISNTAEFIRAGKIYHSDKEAYAEGFRKKAISLTLELLETFADLSVDVITNCLKNVHIAAALTLNVFIGIIGLVKAWRDTA